MLGARCARHGVCDRLLCTGRDGVCRNRKAGDSVMLTGEPFWHVSVARMIVRLADELVSGCLSAGGCTDGSCVRFVSSCDVQSQRAELRATWMKLHHPPRVYGAQPPP